ncbi:MAG TPA: formate dehydrogenase accessory protein FdhE [Candidatus Acidoferrum sp.]|jgi:FdhE protein
MTGPYDARIRRADRLATQQPFATEILALYRHIAEFQRDLHATIRATNSLRLNSIAAESFRAAFDVSTILPHFPKFLVLIQRVAPAPLATAARDLQSQSPAFRQSLLTAHLSVIDPASSTDSSSANDNLSEPAAASASLPGSPSASASSHHASTENASHSPKNPLANPLLAFFPAAFLQPYAEFLAAHVAPPPPNASSHSCPICSSPPLLGVLRQEGDGGKRFLLCSFCLREWEFRRILCPACAEETERSLPVYTAEQLPHIRVEACDTCHFYLRTIDLTKDGNAVPIVDDLAALPLTLWANEHIYSRIYPNLLST